MGSVIFTLLDGVSEETSEGTLRLALLIGVIAGTYSSIFVVLLSCSIGLGL